MNIFNINHTYIYSLYIYIKFSPATLSWMKMTIYCMIMWNAYNLTFIWFFHSVNPSWMNINMSPALCNYFWKKTSFLFPSNRITGDHRGLRICCFFGFLASKDLNYFGFQIFWLRRYQMKVIPETRRVHQIWYLRFNQNTTWFSIIRHTCRHFVFLFNFLI